MTTEMQSGGMILQGGFLKGEGSFETIASQKTPLQVSYNTSRYRTPPGNPPTQLWKESLFIASW